MPCGVSSGEAPVPGSFGLGYCPQVLFLFPGKKPKSSYDPTAVFPNRNGGARLLLLLLEFLTLWIGK
jgi:hypothetical protein